MKDRERQGVENKAIPLKVEAHCLGRDIFLLTIIQ
jgi:hypothetical protein